MRRAFTAIELVVVLVLIAILAIMLVPALEKGRDEAIRIKCLSRLRQVGMACTMYQSDHSGDWPSARVSVCAEHPEWPDPTGALAILYPGYASQPYLFRCPATDDLVVLESNGMDFMNCANFYVSPKGEAMREADEGKKAPMPPSYFYDGGWAGGGGIPRQAFSSRVVYGDECVHGYLGTEEGEGEWIGQNNHADGGNFLFVDLHAEWLRVEWTGVPWQKGKSSPYVPNPHVRSQLGRMAEGGAWEDTNVFVDDSDGRRRRSDADLAGMMWVGDSWKEF